MGIGLVDKIKLYALAYWRYERQHIMGAIECGDADVLTITKALMVTETEIKITIADMRREGKTKRYKHLRMSGGLPSSYSQANYFYFLVPEELHLKATMVCDELYPYVGLLVYKENGNGVYSTGNILCTRVSKRFNRPKPDIKEILRIGYASSNTAIRFGNKLLGGKG